MSEQWKGWQELGENPPQCFCSDSIQTTARLSVA